MSQDDAKNKYIFKRKLEELKKHHGRATELISLYVPPGRQIADVVNYLKNEYAQSGNIKSRTTRKNVMWAIDSLIGRVRAYRKPPVNGVIFFVGTVALEGDKSDTITEVLEPPEPINTFLYRCDSAFYLEPLEDIIKEKDIYGLIVIDRAEVTIGLLRGKRIVVIKNKESNVPSKHGRGGQSQLRFERLIEQAAHDFFKRSAELAEESFLPLKETLSGILIGGPGATKEYFFKEDYLHYELKKKVIEPLFDTGYTNEYGLKELVEKASKTLENLELSYEKKLMQNFLDEVRKPQSGLAVYGEELIRTMLKENVVKTLYISEALRKYRVTLQCNNNDYSDSKTIDNPANLSLTCPACRSSLSITEKKDLVEELYNLAESSGASIEIISTESEEGAMFYRAFGGIGAILRYNVGA